MRLLKTTVLFILISVASTSLSGQTILRQIPGQNTVYSQLSINPSTLFTLGYQRYLKNPVLNRQIILFGEISTSLFAIGIKDAELKLGGTFPLYERNRFKIVNSINGSFGSVSTINFDSKKIAIGDEFAIGLYGPKGFFAATVELENIFLNHLTHTDYFRQTYYPDVKDGWYRGLGGLFQAGISGGFTVKKKLDIHASLRIPFTQKFNNYMGSPFHILFGIRYSF